MLVQTLYTSQARMPMADAGNGHILLEALAYNPHHGLTGFLFRSRNHFLQFLEGAEHDVKEVMARITLDPRHEQVLAWPLVPTSARLFGDWTMGFAGGVAEPEVLLIRSLPRTVETLATLRPKLREMAAPYFSDPVNAH